MKKIILLLSIVFSTSIFADDIKHFWPKIPFNIEGANLCEFRSAYSQTRSDYMNEMIGYAERLLYMGDTDPLRTIVGFNNLYNQNLRYAKKGLGHTLENSFKAYLYSYYRKLRPRVEKIQFKYFDRIAAVLNQNNGGYDIQITESDLTKLDLMAYGSYSMSPDCRGGVFVTLTVISKDGISKEYFAKGPAHTVMSQIASRVFEDYQRTQFPSRIRVGQRYITLLGGLNGSVDHVVRPEDAMIACETIDGRLPTEAEYKVLNSYGDWSGGISLSHHDWALRGKQILNISHYYHTRSYQSGVNGNYKYICVK